MYFGKSHVTVLVLVTVLTSVYVQNCCGQHGDRANNRRNQRLRNRGSRVGGMNPMLHRAYLELLQQTPTTTTESPRWSELAPSVPPDSEVECYVDIPTIQRRGGRCIQLGGNTSRPYICQSGEQIELSLLCQFLMEFRAEQQAPSGEPQE